MYLQPWRCAHVRERGDNVSTGRPGEGRLPAVSRVAVQVSGQACEKEDEHAHTCSYNNWPWLATSVPMMTKSTTRLVKSLLQLLFKQQTAADG